MLATREWKWAQDAIDRLGDQPGVSREDLLAHLASAQAQAGNLDLSLTTAKSIQNTASRDRALWWIVMERIEQRQWADVEKVAELLDSPLNKFGAWVRLGVHRFHEGDVEEGRKLVEKGRRVVESLGISSTSRATLAHAYAEMRNLKAAVQLMEAEPAVSRPSIFREKEWSEMYAKAGDFEKALHHARLARSELSKNDFPFREIVSAQVKAEQWQKAWETAAEMNDGYFKGQALRQLGVALYRKGKKESAVDAFGKAVKIAEALIDRELLSDLAIGAPALFRELGMAHGEVGETALARLWIERQPTSRNQFWALLGLAEGLQGRLVSESSRE
jgi:tetratricopeptide (TPR) repeat protein